ncbi:MAG: RusA family crossover junction endodeoxyribonuclease [Sporolactobacillus sp.]
MIEFTIYGEPIGQGRPRFTTIAGHARAYDPPDSREYKKYVKMMAVQNRPHMPIEGPVSLKLLIYRPLLKSMSKKKKAAAVAGTLRPTKKPDVDNVAKGVMDAMTGIIWQDDKQVVKLDVEKFYSQQPRVEVRVVPLDEQVEQLNLI